MGQNSNNLRNTRIGEYFLSKKIFKIIRKTRLFWQKSGAHGILTQKGGLFGKLCKSYCYVSLTMFTSNRCKCKLNGTSPLRVSKLHYIVICLLFNHPTRYRAAKTLPNQQAITKNSRARSNLAVPRTQGY